MVPATDEAGHNLIGFTEETEGSTSSLLSHDETGRTSSLKIMPKKITIPRRESTAKKESLIMDTNFNDREPLYINVNEANPSLQFNELEKQLNGIIYSQQAATDFMVGFFIFFLITSILSNISNNQNFFAFASERSKVYGQTYDHMSSAPKRKQKQI